MDETPLILIVGGDALTERVYQELTSTRGHAVRIVWPVEADCDEALEAAGVQQASAILTLSGDDGLNLAVALRARMLRPSIRVVLRQFNPRLGAKVEQNLPNCTAVSPAALSAATYAGAALDAGCFFALRFPEDDGPLLGFSETSSEVLGVAGTTVARAEAQLHLRILALDQRLDPPAGASIGSGAKLVTFGQVAERTPHRSRESRSSVRDSGFKKTSLAAEWQRLNPILRIFIVSAICFFSMSYGFFHFVLHRSWTAAGFYVVETMTNVGFGDTTVVHEGPLVTFGAMLAMLGGIVFTSIFIGTVSSAMTRAQWISMQGLRRIRAHGHVVVCGCGKIGRAVVDILTASGKRVVVIEPNPDAALVRRARERDVDLLTGDANRDDALDLCDLPNAAAVLALTDNDAVNLEIGLAARARSADVPIVLRMENDSFAQAAAAVFGIRTFAPAALTAPALAGLSRFPGTHGRVHFAGDDFTIGQRDQGQIPERPPARLCTALCVWRNGELVYLSDFEAMKPFDRVLFVVPLSQFRDARESTAFTSATRRVFSASNP